MIILNPFYMSNSEPDYESLVFRIEQVEQNQQVMARYIASAQLHQQLNELSLLPEAPVEVADLPTESDRYSEESQLQPLPVQSAQYQLVFDRSGSRAVLMSALLKAQKRLIIVCPWLSRNSIDADLMQKFRDCLSRNCRIDIGWGYLNGWDKKNKGWGNSALKNLRQLEQDYPQQFKLKLLGTHEKFLICDTSFTMLGSHNMLTSNTQGFTREVGIRTTDPNIIQGLINRFDGDELQDTQVVDENLAADFVSLDDAEPDADEETDDSASYSPKPAINAGEFYRRYNDKKERDFTGINLSGANLSKQDLSSGVNLSESELSQTNLTQADLTKGNLVRARLHQAILYEANLSQTNLYEANLTAANLYLANLTAANLYGANLTAANLNGANLVQANLKYANLTAADLSGAQLKSALLNSTNFYSAKLNGVNLVGLNLKGVNLSGASLSGANLCGTDLGGQNLSGVNLSRADLRGSNLERANLENANLERANLTGANLSGANLKEVKLSGTIMLNGTVHE